MFFIHKYKDGSLVKFTKTPQVKHLKTETIFLVEKYPYLRTITGRIVKVIKSYQQQIDTAKDLSYERLENVWVFECICLDNGETIKLYPASTICTVFIKWYNLFFYKIYLYIKNSLNAKS